MHHLDLLKRRIVRPEAVLQCGDVLKAMREDRAGLGRLFADCFRAIADPRSNTAAPVSGDAFAIVRPDAADPPPRQFSLALALHEAGEAATFTDQPGYALLLPMNAPVDVAHFLIDEDWTPDVFSPRVRALRVGGSVVAPGEVLRLSPGRSTCRLGFRADTVLLELRSSLVAEVEWSFDACSGRAWRCASRVPAHADAESSCDRARALGDARAIPALRGLLDHRWHGVRWAAARAIVALDRDEGEVALRMLGADPHPDLVCAARQALAARH